LTAPSPSSSSGAGASFSAASRPAKARDDPFLVEAVANVAMLVAETRGSVTADDVRQSIPDVPFKRSVFGAAFRSLQQQGRLIPDGFEPSRVPSNHGRRIQVYRPRQVKACLGTGMEA
jgi:hypothetical protein